MELSRQAPRLLIVPGLHDSGPTHWQTWLQGRFEGALRVRQRDWKSLDLERWAERIGTTLEHAGEGPWIAAAHSFGCLALARHLQIRPDSTILAALFVAPAEPDKFGVAGLLPQRRLAIASAVVASDTDPWMSTASARRWAQRWGASYTSLGDAGHINAASGYGPLPLAQHWVDAARERLARELHPEGDELREGSFAI
jgi:predicted alpha/beta hydrolase family esterase